MTTLSDLERETASRLGPFYDLVATGGTATAVVVDSLRTNTEPGGPEGLYLLRRGALRPNDRVRTVERVDGPTGSLVVDFPYEDTPLPDERIELHHLHPQLQLRLDVHAALRRCYLLDTLTVAPAPDPPDPPDPPEPQPAGPIDLTAQAFWLTAARQVLALALDGVTQPLPGRYGVPNAGGWTCYASRGRLYLSVPGGVAATSITVRAYRDAFGLVNDADDPAGPQQDDDELAIPLDYGAAFAHIEAWRRHRDRLEAAAAEGRFAQQVEVSAEATRVAALYADWLFRPHTERGDRPAPPAAGAGATSTGWDTLGGTGALAGAVVNINDPRA